MKRPRERKRGKRGGMTGEGRPDEEKETEVERKRERK